MNVIVSNLNYIALTLALLLSGCYQSVNTYDINRAVKHCGGVENIVEINLVFTGDESVLCSDGQRENMRGLPAK